MEAAEWIVSFIIGASATLVAFYLLIFVAAGVIGLVNWFRRID